MIKEHRGTLIRYRNHTQKRNFPMSLFVFYSSTTQRGQFYKFLINSIYINVILLCRLVERYTLFYRGFLEVEFSYFINILHI